MKRVQVSSRFNEQLSVLTDLPFIEVEGPLLANKE